MRAKLVDAAAVTGLAEAELQLRTGACPGRSEHRLGCLIGEPLLRRLVLARLVPPKVYALRHATHRRAALVVNRDTPSLTEPAISRLRARRREHEQEQELRAIIADGVDAGANP